MPEVEMSDNTRTAKESWEGLGNEDKEGMGEDKENVDKGEGTGDEDEDEGENEDEGEGANSEEDLVGATFS